MGCCKGSAGAGCTGLNGNSGISKVGSESDRFSESPLCGGDFSPGSLGGGDSAPERMSLSTDSPSSEVCVKMIKSVKIICANMLKV